MPFSNSCVQQWNDTAISGGSRCRISTLVLGKLFRVIASPSGNQADPWRGGRGRREGEGVSQIELSSSLSCLQEGR